MTQKLFYVCLIIIFGISFLFPESFGMLGVVGIFSVLQVVFTKKIESKNIISLIFSTLFVSFFLFRYENNNVMFDEALKSLFEYNPIINLLCFFSFSFLWFGLLLKVLVFPLQLNTHDVVALVALIIIITINKLLIISPVVVIYLLGHYLKKLMCLPV